MHRNVTRKQDTLFPNTAFSSCTKLINSFQTVHLYEINIISHTSRYGVWRVWPIYFIVSMQNLNSKKIINGINAFSRSKSKRIWNAVKNTLQKFFKKALSKTYDMYELGCISYPLLSSFKPTFFFTGEVSLENNFCKVWWCSDQIWPPCGQFLQGSTPFFHVFLPLESAVFNKLKIVDINRCPYFFHIFWKKKF